MNGMNNIDKRFEVLKKIIASYVKENVMVAFSGGVDSSLILKLSCEAAKESGHKVFAVMLKTMLHPAKEVGQARTVAKEVGADFFVLQMDELNKAGILKNPVDRCYLCKKYLFGELKKEAEKLGARIILEGTNEDDLHVYRPGIRAIKELGIISPLAEAKMTKQDVRALAEEYGISVSKKASTPCLATRFPYGTFLSYEKMHKVEQGEGFLKSLGMYNVRLRVHEDVARIEVDAADMDKVITNRLEIAAYLKTLGYRYITLDVEGFRSGSMDDFLKKEEREDE